MEIIKRAKKLAFYGVGTSPTTYSRMQGFTEMSTSKNPIEYSRQYVDEDYERSDITGYSPSISFGFDQISGNAIHTDIISIFDEELMGDDAVRPIIIIDTTKTTDNAIKRNFAIIPDSEGDGTDAYTYSGTFKVAGDKIVGTAVSSDNWATCTFTANA